MIQPKMLMLAGGAAASALGLGWMAMKGDDKKGEGADPSSKDPTGAVPPGTAAAPGTDPSATGGAGTAAPLQGEQRGPFTIVDDQGTRIVFETATQQPVGVMDEQGNVVPITIDAAGNVAPAGDPVVLNADGSTTPVPAAPQAGMTAPTTQAAGGAAQYSQLAASLFSGVANPAVGTAASDPMAGAGQITDPAAAPAPMTPADAGSVAPPMGAEAGVATTGGGTTSRQVGPYTVVTDATGMDVVFETATRMPIGVLNSNGQLMQLPPMPAY